MRSAILIATFFIVEVVSKNAVVIFDLTKCVTDFVYEDGKGKTSRNSLIDPFGRCQFPIRGGKHHLELKTETSHTENKVHSKRSDKNYPNYFCVFSMK
uniref:Putative secreted protein n=1 Tax=Ixodes ricinus TaxID=34613 RepID=A0A0K8R744_IXORI